MVIVVGVVVLSSEWVDWELVGFVVVFVALVLGSDLFVVSHEG